MTETLTTVEPDKSSQAEAPDEWQEIEQKFMELSPIFVQAIELIKDGILEGKWTNIIAEDASGRIPAMVIRKVISRVYQGQGLPPPPLEFLAGRRYISDQETLDSFDSHAETLKQHTPGRALLITENIEKGESIGGLLQSLMRAEIPTDVLTFASSGGTELLKDMSWIEKRKLRKNTDFYIRKGKLDGSLEQITHPGSVQPENISLTGLTLELKKKKLTGISKEHLWKKADYDERPTYKGQEIPVAAITDKESYLIYRELASKMADEVYEQVFGAEAQTEDLGQAA